MSHYSGHNPPVQPPTARVAFFGVTLVAAGYFGFYTFLKKKYERKHIQDRMSDGQARLSSWEYRMLQRANSIPSENSPAPLLVSRVENRNTPISAPTSTHNDRHRTLTDDAEFIAASNGARDFTQPTAQKGHSDGRPGVYTKNPGWREQAHFVSGMKAAGTGYGEGEQQAVAELVEKAKDGVKSVFGK